MSSRSCIIRFVDDDDEIQAFVAREDHGHPEEIITNLSHLQIVMTQQEERPPPDNIAAQFVFIDKLWYALQDVALEDLREELMGLLQSPAETDMGNAGTYLHQHTILDSTSEVEPVFYIYTVEIPDEGEWQIKIGENTHSFDGPVEEVFELVSWDFEGEIYETLDRLQ